MHKPAVSFIVPCYKLAHLLPECVNSILGQTFQDFEILIMDDNSPDNTAEVAASFSDPRVKHVRNDPNLGHLRNYNRGIELSRGKYIWLISADDYLRKPYVLQRYVEVFELNPRVGYAFCTGFGVCDGKETTILGRYSQRRDRDRIFDGHRLLNRLLQSNFVLTPSGCVRRECYEQLSLFDLGMPWCGDWYLWCLFALHYQVAYFAEPMVCYRQNHDLSMTTKLTAEKLDACAAEEIAVPWKIRDKAEAAGYDNVVRLSLAAVARTYARTLAASRYRNASTFMNFEMFEASLRKHAARERDCEYIRAHVWLSIGNEYYWQGDLDNARKFYQRALRSNPWMLTAWIKSILLAMGKPGEYVRRTIFAFR
jgi:glycosyltransferase involved in cell wall biosynthesis